MGPIFCASIIEARCGRSVARDGFEGGGLKTTTFYYRLWVICKIVTPAVGEDLKWRTRNEESNALSLRRGKKQQLVKKQSCANRNVVPRVSILVQHVMPRKQRSCRKMNQDLNGKIASFCAEYTHANMISCKGWQDKQLRLSKYMTKRPHRRRIWTVQLYSPGCPNVTPSNRAYMLPSSHPK